MTWTKGIVISHVQHHEDYDTREPETNPPWTRTARLEDGREVTFDWNRLYRNGTYAGNTDVGATVWVSDEGGVSHRQPKDSE